MKSPYQEGLFQCNFFGLQEIRIRVNRPVMLYYNTKVRYLSRNGETEERKQALCATPQELAELVTLFCRNAVYAHQLELKEGFLTLPGGHRVGISGKAVFEGKQIQTVTKFSGVNIRIARAYPGAANHCISHLYEGKRIFNSVIISPPGGGKTTVLRDCARQLSQKFKVTVVDERSEIAASFCGAPQFDVGDQTDVLDGFSKPAGMIHALRSLSPDVIVTDEIGTEEDAAAVSNLLKGGCKILASMHGYSIEEALAKKKKLMALFERAFFLEKQNGIPEVKTCLKL